ncbi:hypothetical protein AVEN_197809-1 [Araneus ventricosus]|uniref:Uncharacterized protein n=1 Tax=Araneus ventricosus TaxID=182803 RepID=A0A4Y2NM39_ARAVE|nr:hypothetical protein AVEN_197809-1 [Araneus ventricosus]
MPYVDKFTPINSKRETLLSTLRLLNRFRLRWLDGKASALQLEDSRFESDATTGIPYMLAWGSSKSGGSNTFPLVWCKSLERRCRLKCYHVIRPLFNITRFVPE